MAGNDKRCEELVAGIKELEARCDELHEEMMAVMEAVTAIVTILDRKGMIGDAE